MLEFSAALVGGKLLPLFLRKNAALSSLVKMGTTAAYRKLVYEVTTAAYRKLVYEVMSYDNESRFLLVSFALSFTSTFPMNSPLEQSILHGAQCLLIMSHKWSNWCGFGLLYLFP